MNDLKVNVYYRAVDNLYEGVGFQLFGNRLRNCCVEYCLSNEEIDSLYENHMVMRGDIIVIPTTENFKEEEQLTIDKNTVLQTKEEDCVMKEINIIIKPIEVNVGDIIYLSTDCEYDKNFKQWSANYFDDYVVTKVDYENGLVWIKDCPYSIDIWSIINTESKSK